MAGEGGQALGDLWSRFCYFLSLGRWGTERSQDACRHSHGQRAFPEGWPAARPGCGRREDPAGRKAACRLGDHSLMEDVSEGYQEGTLEKGPARSHVAERPSTGFGGTSTLTPMLRGKPPSHQLALLPSAPLVRFAASREQSALCPLSETWSARLGSWPPQAEDRKAVSSAATSGCVTGHVGCLPAELLATAPGPLPSA